MSIYEGGTPPGGAAPPGAGDGAGAAPGAPDHGGPSAFDKLGEPTTKTDPKHLGIIAAASVVAVVIIIVLVNSRSDDAGVTAYGGGSGSHASYSSYSGQGPPSANTQGSAGETYFIRDSMRQLSQGMEHESVALPLDYAIQFDIVPGPQLVTAWSSIVHFTATGNNCCEYGDRVPGIWFMPGTRKLDIIDGHGGLGGQGVQGNDECQLTEELQPGLKYTVRVAAHIRSKNTSRCT